MTVRRRGQCSPDILLHGLLPLVPFWCFLSSGVGGALGRLSREEGEGPGEEAGRRSSAEGEALGRLSGAEGGPLGILPLGTRSGGLREGLSMAAAEDEDEDEEDDVVDVQLSRTWAPSFLPRQGIFSRLTTGTGTHGRPRAPFGG